MTESVKFGIIGAGRIAANKFAPAIANASGAELLAVASRDLLRAQAFGAPRSYGSYDELLQDRDVEAVYIATHNGLHAELARKAMGLGKHVLCEKPLGRNEEECRGLVNAAFQNNRQLAEAFMYRHHPQIEQAKKLVEGGAIGEIKTVEAAFSFRLTREDDIRLNPDWGGGALLDVGCYCVNFCRLFLGDHPERIQAVGAFHPEHGVDMSLHGTLDYGEGKFGVISCGFDAGLRNSARLAGTRGILTLPHVFLSWDCEPSIVVEGEGDPTVYKFEAVDVFQREIEDFATAVRGNSAPLLAANEGVHNARIMDALLESARSYGA